MMSLFRFSCLSILLVVPTMSAAEPPIHELQLLGSNAPDDGRHTKVIATEVHPGPGTVHLGNGYYLIYSEEVGTSKLAGTPLSTTYAADFPTTAALFAPLIQDVQDPEKSSDLIPVLFRFFDLPPVRQDLGEKTALFEKAPFLPDPIAGQIFAMGSGLLRTDQLLELADIDGVIWIEPLAFGIMGLGEGAAQVVAGKTTRTPYRHYTTASDYYESVLERPIFAGAYGEAGPSISRGFASFRGQYPERGNRCCGSTFWVDFPG